MVPVVKYGSGWGDRRRVSGAKGSSRGSATVDPGFD